ncbi:MAG: hypothetical protein KGD59_10305 [Candidatus Heimdallarchaeota archaeon]|nr:hypothetical protein [Candidatus Heimdallarchaeota archaeon]MBY8994930.1 hypothetical protein [Candidatus Heimdallarchaeota archaeon]
MSREAIKYEKLDKRYIAALLESLEERKAKGDIDSQLYQKLKDQYIVAYEEATDDSVLRDGFITLQAIAPDPDTIRSSVKQLLKRIQDLTNEQTKVEQRFGKLDDLLKSGKISENIYKSKKKEYEILLLKIEDQKQELITRIPDSLEIIQEMNEGLDERIEELTVKSAVESVKGSTTEKQRLDTIKNDIIYAAKELSKISKQEYKSEEWLRGKTPSKQPVIAADFTPLRSEVAPVAQRSAAVVEEEEPLRPPPGTNVWVKWKGITIGKLVGELKLVGGHFGIIATDRPSLAIIRDFALTGPSKLRSSTNPKVIEDRLKKSVMDTFNVDEADALLPENMINYAIRNKIGVDLLRLMNSYYASVGKGAMNITREEITINDSAQVLTLAENVGLLGRRVLAPDRTLIGVIHELYYDSTNSQLYTFSFKGVPPAVIRKIYRDVHNRTMTDGTFSEFRNEVSKLLSIPIYEALTPSSILKFSLMSGVINSLGQLVTLIESMNPRISKSSDITAISSQGISLSRFPQNALPRIEILEY